MIDIKEGQVLSMLEEAVNQLQSGEGSKLVCLTKKIDGADPLRFFEAAKQLSGSRSFWTSASRSMYLAGAGKALEISADEDRFTETERRWEQILEEAIVHNPYQAPGTGVTAVGGLSFDPEKKPTALWKAFRPSMFIIPEFLLTVHRDDCYLTVNVNVKQGDDAEQLATELEQMEKSLFSSEEDAHTPFAVTKKMEIEPEKWKDTVAEATRQIRDGKSEKIVLAREVRLKFDQPASISSILENLCETQSNSYIFAYEVGEDCFVGATPERLVKLEKNNLLSTCLAGTAPRGKTEAEDRKISAELLNDEKNLQEHQFVVQMIKKAIEQYCTDVIIPDSPVIYPLKNLQHLYTPVTGSLKAGYSILDVVSQLHPTPALGGTPREESLAFIREEELLDRGWYGGPIGWMDSSKNGEFAVAIRSALVQGDEASLFAGCGVVKDSDPESEYEETTMKLLPMLSVLGGRK